MPVSSAIRLPALLLGGSLLCLGCGDGSQPVRMGGQAPVASVRAASGAPRTLDRPDNARPISGGGSGRTPHLHRIVLFEQALAPASHSQPRITQMAATPDAAAVGMIREPGTKAPEVREPSVESTATLSDRSRPLVDDIPQESPDAVARSSPYIPVQAPPPTAPPTDPPPPQLSSQPVFEQPAVADNLAAEAPPEYRLARSAEPNSTAALATMPTASHAGRETVPPPGATTYLPDQTATQPSAPVGNSPALRAAIERAAQISERGFVMAQRGMLFAGREELIKSLQLLAQALDVQSSTGAHAVALASGLDALCEARDFAAPATAPGAALNVAQTAATHRTAVLRTGPAGQEISPVVAQQMYLAFAQNQLALAGGNQRVASQALYRLGRVQSALAATSDDREACHAPQAMVFHQAALAVDSANYLAANELGVLLARYGQLEDARRLLVHSVSMQPQVESWQNLAAVHRRLGEDDLARRAESERDLLAKKNAPAAAHPAKDFVRWVDPPTFAATAGKDIPWPEHTAAAAGDTSSQAQRR